MTTATLTARDAPEHGPGWRYLEVDCKHATTVSYAQNLERLANAGKLTEDVETAFRDFAETSATAVVGLAADFGSSLHLLVKTHNGQYRRRLR